MSPSAQILDQDYPEQSYFPRWWCRLTIRFGEFGQLGQLLQLTPTKVTRSLTGNNPQRNALVPVLNADTGQYDLLPQGVGEAPPGGPQAQTASSDARTQKVTGIVPTEFTWSQNGPRTGDTLSMTISLADCPVDPRTVRSVAVEFFLGTVTAAVAGAQVEGMAAVDLLPETYTDSNGNPRTNRRFQGWVDKWKSAWSDGQPVINLECTDNTRLLLKVPCPSKMQISHTLPLDQAVANYLAAFPSLEGLSVEYRPVGATPPVIGKISTKASIRTHKGPPITKNSGAEKMMLLDLLTDTCRALGHAVFVEGSSIVIARIRSITSSAIEPRADDPYVPRVLPDGSTLQNRLMLYGRNVSSVDIERDFNVHAPVNVSVRSMDTDGKQLLVERFPLKEDAQVYALPDNALDQNWVEHEVCGVKDPATLRAFAQEIYENLGRQEIAISVSTKSFASFGGGNTDPDLLDTRFGDAMQLLFNAEDFYSSLNELQKDLDSVALNSQRLQRVGFPAAFADAYATAYTNAGFQDTYRVHQVSATGSAPTSDDDGGVKFDLKLVNYVEVTSDKSLAPGEEPASNPPAQRPAAPLAPPPPDAPLPGTTSTG